jgi:hypothetical protein
LSTVMRTHDAGRSRAQRATSVVLGRLAETTESTSILSPTARHHQDVTKFDVWRRLCRSPCVSVSLTGGLCRSPVYHAIAASKGSFSVLTQKRQERNKTRAQRVWDAQQRRPKVWRYALAILSRAERMRRLTEPRSSPAARGTFPRPQASRQHHGRW